MHYNGKCTLLQDGALAVLDCWWEDAAAVNVQKYGIQNASSARVFLPLNAIEPKTKSYLIRGEYTGAADVGAFLKAGGKATMTCDRFDFGSAVMQHYEVTLK